ncbi:MAG: hypothetical protein HN780_16630 [Gemmatimonadetes bacterium]|nr:hypothetical protein [Gemmatimonadota bacterium]
MAYLKRTVTIACLVETYDLAIFGHVFVQDPFWPLRPGSGVTISFPRL